jgi:hypothetical protein
MMEGEAKTRDESRRGWEIWGSEFEAVMKDGSENGTLKCYVTAIPAW